jgi:hypothetical protein
MRTPSQNLLPVNPLVDPLQLLIENENRKAFSFWKMKVTHK